MSPNETNTGQFILVVDGSPETPRLLTDALEANGIPALVARSGARALSLLERVSPDAILIDAVMPEMDSFELCRRIKESRESVHVPVIFMTELADPEQVLKAFAAGGVDYVIKPVDPAEILARLRTHIANARLAQSARIALDLSGTAIMAVNGQAELLWTTPRALAHLKDVLAAGNENCPRAVLPDLNRAIAEAAAGGTQWHHYRGLQLSYLGEGVPGELLFSVSEGNMLTKDELLRERLGLTERETEVLLWIAQGKTNKDIAAILHCSHRTINKHLEQIFGKLGVENRTAAATFVVRALLSRQAQS